MTSASSQSLNVPGSRRNRQSTSSGSTIPEIIIQPPVRTNSLPALSCIVNSIFFFGMYSRGPLPNTLNDPPSERQGSLVQIMLTVLFLLRSVRVRLRVLRWYPQSRIHLWSHHIYIRICQITTYRPASRLLDHPLILFLRLRLLGHHQ